MKPKYTWGQVWKAMEELYPEQTAFARKQGTNQVMQFTAICMRCFVDDKTGGTVALLREAYKELEQLGYLN